MSKIYLNLEQLVHIHHTASIWIGMNVVYRYDMKVDIFKIVSDAAADWILNLGCKNYEIKDFLKDVEDRYFKHEVSDWDESLELFREEISELEDYLKHD